MLAWNSREAIVPCNRCSSSTSLSDIGYWLSTEDRGPRDEPQCHPIPPPDLRWRRPRTPPGSRVRNLGPGLFLCAGHRIPGVALAQVPLTKVTSYGGFKVSGPVSGTLTPLAGTCDASNSAADVEFSWFGKVKTLKGVSAQSIVSIELDLQGSSYGRPGTLKNTDGKPPFLTFGATTESGPAVSWQSTSGTYSTIKRGVSGSLDVVLDQADGKPGRLTIKGSWQDCRVGGNI